MSVTKAKGLGRGFDALIPQNFDSSLIQEQGERVEQLPVRNLVANPEQPRKQFDQSELEGLAQSIAEHGVIQPLVVTSDGTGKYYVIAGERRWRASLLAGIETVPAVVRTIKQLQRLELAIVENVQRVDLSPLEQAASIVQLHEQFSQDMATIAKRLGKAPSTVQNIVRLLQLPDQAKQALAQGNISEGHARAILALKEENDRLKMLELIISNGWSVRQAERYASAQKAGIKQVAAAKKRVETSNKHTERLSQVIKAPVSLRRTAKGGKIEISFKTDAEFKRIIAILSKQK